MWIECIILIRHSKTVFNKSDHNVFLNFSVSLFMLLTSALSLPHQYLADNNCSIILLFLLILNNHLTIVCTKRNKWNYFVASLQN